MKSFCLSTRPLGVPDPLWERLVLLAGKQGSGPVSSQSLAEISIRHLERMIGSRGEAREEAFCLLAVDALVTYACEFAMKEDDVDMESALYIIFDILKAGTDSRE